MDTFWLYLEPYTFISEDSDYFFFYNTNIQKGISFRKTKLIKQIIDKMIDIENLYSVKIEMQYFNNDDFYEFIKKIQLFGFGDIIEGDEEKPVIMPPILNLQRSVERLKQHDISIGENILSYLHEIVIYVNGECSLNCKDCHERFKQYLCCTKSNTVLDFLLLEKFLLSIAYARVTITISGGNIFYYEKLQYVINLLHEMNVEHTFVINWRNILDHVETLYLLSHDLCRLKILVTTLTQVELLLSLAKKVKQYNITQIWEIGITSIEEYEEAENLSKKLAVLKIDVIIRPFYDGGNITFFEENVFIYEEDFDTLALDRQQIFALQELNTNDFGKIIILSDGKMYANVNRESIGYIGDSLGEILSEELVNGSTWRCTRYKISPCSQCRFRLVCPSPSNYELTMKRANLCHVNRTM